MRKIDIHLASPSIILPFKYESKESMEIDFGNLKIKNIDDVPLK